MLPRFSKRSNYHGDAYDSWFTCKVDLQKVKNPFSGHLLEEMKKKEEILFENEAFLGSLFLDSRWKVVLKTPFVERAIDHIVRVNTKINTVPNVVLLILRKVIRVLIQIHPQTP